MKAIERLGITKESFHEIYEAKNGFNSEFNKNHPGYEKDESCLTFMNCGVDTLLVENEDIVNDIISNIK